jgi:hypothetical protein
MAGRSNELAGLIRHWGAEGPPHKTPTARPPPAARCERGEQHLEFRSKFVKRELTAFREKRPGCSVLRRISPPSCRARTRSLSGSAR